MCDTQTCDTNPVTQRMTLSFFFRFKSKGFRLCNIGIRRRVWS